MLIAAAVALAAAGCTGSTVRQANPMTTLPTHPGARPANIVFVLTDDLSMNLVSHMPRVLAMQRTGTTMARYYVVDSLCCPSRAAILTGEYPHNNGVYSNGGKDGGYQVFNQHRDDQRSFPLALQKAGYRTALSGKYLNGYRTTDDPPRGYDDWHVADGGYQEFGYTLNQNGEQHSYGHLPSDYLVDVQADEGVNFIHDAASAHVPFLLEVATFAPHSPYTPAPRYANSDPHVRYPRTPSFDTVPTAAPRWLAAQRPLTRLEKRQIDVAYRQRVRAVHAVDDLIGRLQRALIDNGLAQNTYLVFTSDNGYHMGEYRLLPGKKTAFDTDIQVPLVVTGPGVAAGRRVDQLASNIDLAPTFEAIGGAKIRPYVDGVSLLDLWHGQRPTSWQRAVLIEHHGPNAARGDPDWSNAHGGNPPTYEAIRTADALYVRYASGTEEYYDTARDPYQLHNLAGRGVAPTLRTTLSALATCHGAAHCQRAAGRT